MSIEIRVNQLMPYDLVSLPILQDDGTYSVPKLDTSFIQDEDVLISGYDSATPVMQKIVDDLVAGNGWEGHYPKSIKLEVSCDITSTRNWRLKIAEKLK